MATPPIDPRSILTGLFTPQAQQTSAPQLPTTSDPIEASTLQTMQGGREAFAQAQAQKAALAQQLEQVRQAQMALQQPKMGYQPQFKPATSAKNILGDIGKGALLGLSATGPGQAVQSAAYGPAIRRYGEQEKTLGTQAEELQKQLGTTEQGQAAAGTMATRPAGALARYTVGTQANAIRAAHDKATESLRAQLNQIQQDLGNKKITAENARTLMQRTVESMRDQTLRDVTGVRATTEEDINAQKITQAYWERPGTAIVQELLGGTATAPINMLTPTKPAAKAPGKNAAPAQHVPGGRAGGLQEGATGTGSDGKKYVVRGGKWQAQ